jgi:hypothetical protein
MEKTYFRPTPSLLFWGEGEREREGGEERGERRVESRE